MALSRNGAAACAVDGQLFVFGGYDGSAVLQSVEVFVYLTFEHSSNMLGPPNPPISPEEI